MVLDKILAVATVNVVTIFLAHCNWRLKVLYACPWELTLQILVIMLLY